MAEISKRTSVMKLATQAASLSKPEINSKISDSLLNTPHQSTRLKTGPGAFAAYMASESETNKENAKLKNELKTWADALPVRKIDPKLISPSRWSNRHESSFESEEFLTLKQEIELAGGNVQPIKVRPISGSQPEQFEIVFGHRRHRACLDLNLPIAAVVESIDDLTLFAEMDRENRQRADLRPYEQGVMYARALDEGLYPSIRKLSSDLGINSSGASRLIALARLPSNVLAAFESPLDVQYDWGKKIADAYENDQELIVKRAEEITRKRTEQGTKVTALQVYEWLLHGDHEKNGKDEPTPSTLTIQGAGKQKAEIKIGKDGSTRVVLNNISHVKAQRLEHLLRELLSSE